MKKNYLFATIISIMTLVVCLLMLFLPVVPVNEQTEELVEAIAGEGKPVFIWNLIIVFF